MMSRNYLYLTEPIGDGLTRHWELQRILRHERTDYQDVLIAETEQGVTLFCDADRQSSELSQLAYHEGQIIPALLLAEQRDRVLIIGSSEGAVCQLARAAGATHIDHVDIDESCVRLCAEVLPYGYTVNDLWDHEQGQGGITIHYSDGLAFLASVSPHDYDVIVFDLPDEQAVTEGVQHNRLYEAATLQLVADALAPGGVFITQAGNAALWRNRTLKDMWIRAHDIFAQVLHYEIDEQDWSWILATNTVVNRPAEVMAQRLAKLPITPSFLDERSVGRSLVEPISLRHLVDPS